MMKLLQKRLVHISLNMAAIIFDFYVISVTLASLFLVMLIPRAMAVDIQPTLIQVIDTSSFPAPDTAGIIYVPNVQVPADGYFLVVDSEINEMPIYEGYNVFKIDRQGNLLDSFSTLSPEYDFSDPQPIIKISDEPTGITINPETKHCFFSDDQGTRAVYEVDPGDDELCLTDDDAAVVTEVNVKALFGIGDPEDVTYGLKSLFVVDGVGKRIYRIMLGEDGVFDASDETQSASSFDTAALGINDPEGIAFDSTNNTLYIVGSHNYRIIQTTINGVMLRTIDLKNINPNRPSGLALGPSSVDPLKTNIYMTARGEDNDSVPDENDGMIYELGLPAITVGNQPPLVSAGEDQSIILPNDAQVTGSVSDDAQPTGVLTSTWSKQSGSGDVSFTDPNNVNTTVSFSIAGTYVLRLTADDGDLSSFDELVISVGSAPPVDPAMLNVPNDYPSIQSALSSAVVGDTIVLAPGTYYVNATLLINKNNISIVSRYLTSGDKNDIDATIIDVDPTVRFIDGVLGESANLKLIGLTIRYALKGITFADDYGEVHYCKFIDIQEDAISFDTNAGGAVTHTRVENAGDDAIDIDTRYNGSFLIAYNELINSNDDSIEIHLYDTSNLINMHHDIHDNLFSGSGEDGIQLIDFAGNSKRTFDIYRNIFEGMPDVAIGSMFEATAENFQGTAMAERVRIYNNYFYNNGYHITGGDNMIILNNIFEAATTTAIKRAKAGSITDYNIFYNNLTNTDDTLTGSNNLVINPQRNSDFTLQLGSPAIEAGTSSYSHLSEVVLQMATSEYTGQNPEIGRYEYELDNSAPVITLIGANPINLNVGDTFTDPGATASDGKDGDLTDDIQSSGNVDTSVATTYPITYTVSDSDGNTVSIIRNVVVSNGTDFLQRRVLTSADDAEERADGQMYLNSSDLELVFDTQVQTVGIRFTNLAIPANAIITKAYIQFKVDETDFISNTVLNIVTERTNNALSFNKTRYNISDRTKSNASVSWLPAAWNTIGATGIDQRSPDLSAIVQEIISGTTWNSGNAMVFILSGDGKRVAEAYDGDSAGAPLLYLEYTTGATTIPPVITLLDVNPMNLNLGDTFTDPGATAMDNEDGDLTTAIQVTSNVNTAIAATYQVTYTVSDSDGNTVSITRSVVVSDGTLELFVLQSRVSASTDDAEERADGRMYLNSSDLELVVDIQVQTVGIRFTNLAIPANAIITKAYIQFKVDETDFLANTLLNIVAEKEGNAPTFANVTYNISSRTQTNTSISWSPAGWSSVGAAGTEQRTSDLTSIVNEIVSETGWSSGNAMVFIITGAGVRVAESYDGDTAGAPLLFIEYAY